MTWFRQLFGFAEQGYADTQKRFRADGHQLHADAQPPRSFHIGTLAMPSLAELRAQIDALGVEAGARLAIDTVRADAHALHAWPQAHGALIQVASQFNLLEMPGPGVTPEDGITDYQHDRTQGPACAPACASACTAIPK